MSLPADDLLSAFHDGELNPAERAVLEQRLAASVETRRELSEIQQVSSLLNELPRERLPAEFPQQVLQAIEREMLTPSHRSESVITPASESCDRRVRSRRWVGAAAVLTSATGLLLLVRAVDDRSGREASSVSPLARSPRTLSAPAEFMLDTAENDRDARREFGGSGAVPPPMAADAPVSAFRKSRIAGGAGSGSDSVASKSPANAALATNGVASREKDNLFFDRSALRDAKIGDVVSAMQTEGNEVAVVWLTVVDRQEGLAGLQFLLSDKGIALEDSLEKTDKAATPNADADQMHAVFVESDAEQLAAALKQLRKETFLQSLEVDQPIELAQLGDVRGGRLLAVDKLRDRSSASQSTAKEDAAKMLPEASSAKRRFGTPTSSAEQKKSVSAAAAPAAKTTPGGAKEPPVAKDQLAKQVTLEFPREALVQNQMSQQTRSRAAFRNQVRLQSTDGKVAESAPAEQRPMQVLFVVVDQAQAGKPAPSNNSSKPTAPVKPRTEPAKPAGKDGAA